MHMHIDHAGQNMEARCIQGLVRWWHPGSRPDRDDAPVTNGNRSGEGIGFGDNRAVFDDEISVAGHGVSLVLP